MRKSVFISIIAIAILLAHTLPASGFDYSSFKTSSLKEIGAKTKDAVGCNVKLAKHGNSVLDLYLEKLRIGVLFPGYPIEVKQEEFNIEKFNILEYYFKAFSLNLEHIKLFTHQLDLQASGYAFTFLFPEPLLPHLRKEVKPGDHVSLYVVLGIYDHIRKRTILLVNEFGTEEQKTKKKVGKLFMQPSDFYLIG